MGGCTEKNCDCYFLVWAETDPRTEGKGKVSQKGRKEATDGRARSSAGGPAMARTVREAYADRTYEPLKFCEHSSYKTRRRTGTRVGLTSCLSFWDDSDPSLSRSEIKCSTYLDLASSCETPFCLSHADLHSVSGELGLRRRWKGGGGRTTCTFR